MSNESMMEDEALVTRVLTGDMAAFRLLIRQHEKLVLHMVSRLVRHEPEREEICQDVFLRVYEKLADFRFQSKLSTWIATIAYRTAVNQLRKKRLIGKSFPAEELSMAEMADENTPASILEEVDEEALVIRLMEKLPPAYRLVLSLYHVEHQSYEEIGVITGMPEGTVKNYLFRARKQLKELLQRVNVSG